MKKVILLFVMALSTAFAFAQDATTIKNLKEQQKVLALTSKLISFSSTMRKRRPTTMILQEKLPRRMQLQMLQLPILIRRMQKAL